MGKGVFDQNLDEMLEVDNGLDINEVLASIPPLETEPVKKVEEVKKEEEKGDKTKEVSLKNIDKVLEEQTAELEESKKKVEKEVEIKEDVKSDDKAPASLVKSTDKTSSTAPFTVIFARDLAVQGLLSSFDEEKFNKDCKELGEADALRNLIKSEIDVNINAAKSDLDLGYQEYLSLVGRGVSQESAGSLVELKTRFDSIKVDDLVKEDNVDLRKRVISDYYKLTTSMPDTKINKLVQSSIDLGDDIEDSKEYLTTLKKLVLDQITEEKTEAENNQRLVAEENRRSIETLKEDINILSEVIPGIPVNKQTKIQMFESITKTVQDKQGRTTNAIWAKRTEDPMFFDERLSYLLITGFFDKGKPWTKASQAKVTKEISDLEQAIKSKTEETVGNPVLRNPKEEKTTKDNIDSMRGLFT